MQHPFEEVTRPLRLNHHESARSKFWGAFRARDRGGGDNSIQIINFGRVGDKSFKEWRQK